MRSSTCLSCDDNSLVNGQLSLFTMYCTPLKTWPQFSPRESSYEPLQPLSCKCWPEPPQGCRKDQAKIWDCPYVLNPKKMPLKADPCWSNHKNVSNIKSPPPKKAKNLPKNVWKIYFMCFPLYLPKILTNSYRRMAARSSLHYCKYTPGKFGTWHRW